MEKSERTQSSPDLFGDPIFNITEHGFKELQRASLTLDQLFYLECVKYKVDLKDIVGKDKTSTWRQSLVRKGFITEEGIITVDGSTLLHSVGSGMPFKGSLDKRKQDTEEDFETWWKAYPSSDIFEWKNRKFTGSRAFKIKKGECKEIFDKITNEGEVTGKDLIRCIEYEVLMKKDASVKENENKMKYFKNSASYLGNRLYEGFLEISKQKVSTHQTTGEDI